jgi:hypothetical protein
MRETAGSIPARMGADERASYAPAKIAEIRAEFQRLSERWTALGIGEGMTEPW